MTDTDGRLLSGDDLVAARALIDQADGVELKLTIPESARWSTISALAAEADRAAMPKPG
ncbi:MAG TPA: hypothetical protein VFY82_05630 [Acidimicrobiales bacterium]|nr:hypothetical protein [Acidimicrobiales bacterium]